MTFNIDTSSTKFNVKLIDESLHILPLEDWYGSSSFVLNIESNDWIGIKHEFLLYSEEKDKPEEQEKPTLTDTPISGIYNIDNQKEIKAIYDLLGKRVSKMKPDQLYIIKYSDGTTTKMFGI